MDMAVYATRGHDHVLPRDHFRRRPHHQRRIDALHRVRIPGLADLHDSPVANAYVPLHDAPMVDDERVGNHQIERALRAGGTRALPHAVSNYLAASERDLVAVNREVALDFDD